MVLYTPLDYQDIFYEERTNYKMTSYKGRTVYTRENEDGKNVLVQLLSTNPEDYLAEEFSPGIILPNEVDHNGP